MVVRREADALPAASWRLSILSRWRTHLTSRRETLSAVTGALLLLAGAILIARSHGAMRDTRIAGLAVRILEPERLPAAGTAVVFHGLASNHIIMQQAGQWLAAQEFRVFLVDASGHGKTPGSFTHAAAQDSYLRLLNELARNGISSSGKKEVLNPQTTILVGHSMGVCSCANGFAAANAGELVGHRSPAGSPPDARVGPTTPAGCRRSADVSRRFPAKARSERGRCAVDRAWSGGA